MSAVRDISELTPAAQKACRLFLTECERQGLKVRITETYRSQERQNELYAQGRTTSGKIVTWTRKSRHTSRRAWDICKDVKGEEYSDTAFFKRCGTVAAEFGITWGGTWKTPDMPHFEIAENWEYEEADEMTEAERAKFNTLVETVERVVERVDKLEKPMIYNYIDDNMPEWARSSVKWCADNGIITGTGDGLGLDDKDLKWCAIVKRIAERSEKYENMV